MNSGKFVHYSHISSLHPTVPEAGISSHVSSILGCITRSIYSLCSQVHGVLKLQTQGSDDLYIHMPVNVHRISQIHDTYDLISHTSVYHLPILACTCHTAVHQVVTWPQTMT